MKNTQKGFAGIIILVLAILAVGGYFIFVKEPTSHFSWKGIEFDYPQSWSAEIIKYANPVMQAEGKSEELGFIIKKEGVGSISAGGPQSGGDTCENLKSRGRFYRQCADIKWHDGLTMPLITLDNHPELRQVFNQILSGIWGFEVKDINISY